MLHQHQRTIHHARIADKTIDYIHVEPSDIAIANGIAGDLEYMVVHRGKQGRRFVYELIYQGEGREGQPFLLGLLDPIYLQPPGFAPSSYTIPTSSMETGQFEVQ